MHRCLVLLGISLILVSCCLVDEASAQKHSHPGAIVDAYRRKGISADAYAYNSQAPSKGTDCPNYGTPLDAEKSSSPSGDFTFFIDAKTNSYLAVYCKQGYASRTETINDNRTNNTRVQPDPVTLYPVSGGTDVAYVAIATDLNAVHRNLTYYAKADSASFASATQSGRFTEEDRRIIQIMLGEGISQKGSEPAPYQFPDGDKL
jgi:hypothetical protein